MFLSRTVLARNAQSDDYARYGPRRICNRVERARSHREPNLRDAARVQHRVASLTDALHHDNLAATDMYSLRLGEIQTTEE
jgi:hypothetical protein